MRLELDVLERVNLPIGLGVTGGLLADPSRTVLWGSGGVYVVDRGADARAILETPEDPVQGARLSGAEVLEVMRSGGALLRLDLETGAAFAAEPGSAIGGRIHQAVALATGWLVHRTPDDGRSELALLERGSWTPASVPDPSGEPWPAQLRLAPVGSRPGEALVQALLPPFTLWRLKATEGGVTVDRVLDGEAIRAVMLERGLRETASAALTPVTLDRGYLLQITDLAGDGRLLITLDTAYRIVRATVIDVPLGFLAASPEHRTIAALADTGSQPVLSIYHWQWSAGAPPHLQRKEDLP